MDFMTRLPISSNWKSNNYDFIFIVVDCLTKIVYYKLIWIIIDIFGIAQVIIAIIFQYYNFFDLIMSNQGSVFILKFWSSLCYLFNIM